LFLVVTWGTEGKINLERDNAKVEQKFFVPDKTENENPSRITPLQRKEPGSLPGSFILSVINGY
jgi:hypothetical protein